MTHHSATPYLSFFNDPATPEIYTLSLHDALPISLAYVGAALAYVELGEGGALQPDEAYARANQAVATALELDAELAEARSEEHTSELQSHHDLVCRLLLEKKKKKKQKKKKTT